MQQLQADIQQLREELDSRPRNGVNNIEPINSNVSEGQDFQPTPPVNVSVPERYVYVPRERKCPRFSGKRSHDAMTVEDRVKEVSRSLFQ